MSRGIDVAVHSFRMMMLWFIHDDLLDSANRQAIRWTYSQKMDEVYIFDKNLTVKRSSKEFFFCCTF